MTLPRASIARLMGFVLVSALGLIGLMRPDPTWASLTFTAAVFILIAAVLNTIHGEGQSRAFWGGFAVSGWICWLIAFQYPPIDDAGPPPLASSLAIQRFQALVHPQVGITSSISLAQNSGVSFIPAPLAPPTIALPVLSIPTSAAPARLAIADAPTDPAPTPAGAMDAETPDSEFAPAFVPIAGPPSVPDLPPLPPPLQYMPLTTTAPVMPGDVASIHQVGQSLATLLIGLVGGYYAAHLARRKSRAATARPDVIPSSP